MESLHIIKGLWNLSNIGAENSDTRIKLERDSLGRVVGQAAQVIAYMDKERPWEAAMEYNALGQETSRLVSGGVYSSWEY